MEENDFGHPLSQLPALKRNLRAVEEAQNIALERI